MRGPTALFLLAVLALLEVSLSFDNAIINAAILQRMICLAADVPGPSGLIAVFGMAGVPLATPGPHRGPGPRPQWSWRLGPPAHGAGICGTDRPAMKTDHRCAPQIAAFVPADAFPVTLGRSRPRYQMAEAD